MLIYPNINPIAIHLGPIKIYWYGIMYLVGFALAWLLAKYRSNRLAYNWTNEQISDFIFYCAFGVISGGRLGYVLFYAFPDLIADPWFIFKIWHGGMSFHGGLIGVVIALCCYAHKMQLTILELFDFTAPLVPLALLFGRIGNFINSELWGRVTTMPWGVVSQNGGPLPRHPSQLYEASAEGILLFIVIWLFIAKPKPRGTTTGLFLFGYGIARFICEFFRQPDQQLGFIAFNWLTMGQILSLPLIIIGLITFIYYYAINRGKI